MGGNNGVNMINKTYARMNYHNEILYNLQLMYANKTSKKENLLKRKKHLPSSGIITETQLHHWKGASKQIGIRASWGLYPEGTDRELAGGKLWEDIQIRGQHILAEGKWLEGLGCIGDRDSLSVATSNGGP